MMCADFDDFSDILRDIDQRQDVTVTIWQGMLTILLVAFMLTHLNNSYRETLLSVSYALFESRIPHLPLVSGVDVGEALSGSEGTVRTAFMKRIVGPYINVSQAVSRCVYLKFMESLRYLFSLTRIESCWWLYLMVRPSVRTFLFQQTCLD